MQVFTVIIICLWHNDCTCQVLPMTLYTLSVDIYRCTKLYTYLFPRAHYTTIVPFLVMRKDTAAAKNVAETIGSEWCPLLETCLPKVLVHILPLFAVSKCGKAASVRSVQARVAHATTCYDSLLEVVKQEVGVQLYVSSLSSESKGKFLYSAVSNPQDCSKRFTLDFPDRPVHSDTISASLGSIQPYATINA